ncbi:MAG: hypothetical protein E4H38_04745, partial [Gemmatimonadales bacterium]
ESAARLTTALADRYRIERELGQGGMATVYLAEDLKHQRKVAVKVLRPELAAALGHDRFLREITTTSVSGATARFRSATDPLSSRDTRGTSTHPATTWSESLLPREETE